MPKYVPPASKSGTPKLKDRINWISVEDRWAIYRRDNFTCQMCGELVNMMVIPSNKEAPSLDHIVPRSQGGSDDPSNLRLTCKHCNCWRSDKRPPEARRPL